MTVVTTTDPGRIVALEDEAALRALIGTPNEMGRRKQLSALDPHARTFIGHSPFVLIATSAGDGSCDVSPRGDAPGFVLVLGDRKLAIPDRPGNRRHDSFRNLFENPGIGLLLLVPGMEETLRINGRAQVVREAPWFDQMIVRSKRPLVAIVVDIDEVFFHCPKSFRRSQIWEPATWPERSALPTLGQIFKDQISVEQTANELDCALEESYTRTLY